MDKSDKIEMLANALSKAQATMPAIPKRGRGQVGQQATSYVTFDDLVATVRPLLAANGLSFVQLLDAGSLTTVLMHTSGQWLAGSTPIEAMAPNRGTNEMQAYGSTLTYLKRYALAALLGVASDDDDDGHSATAGAKSTKKRQEHAQAATPEPEPQIEGAAALFGAQTVVEGNGYPVDSWLDFSDYVLDNLEHYTARAHVVNALKLGGIETPWLTWSPEMAARCWQYLATRVEVVK